MAWVRIDDGVPHHPKFLQAGPAAAWLWVCAVAYSQRQLTDGFVPQTAVQTLGVSNPRKLLERLVEVGLMERTGPGWQVHDYLDYNERRDVALARRAAVSASRSDAGKRGAEARWQNDSKPDGKPNSKAMARRNSKPMAPSHPIPSQKNVRKASTAAAPPRTPKFSQHAGEPADDGNYHVILKLAHETIETSGLSDPSDPELLAQLKDRCAQEKIDYGRAVDPDVCSRALTAASRARSAKAIGRTSNGLADMVGELQDAPDPETMGERLRALAERRR